MSVVEVVDAEIVDEAGTALELVLVDEIPDVERWICEEIDSVLVS